MEGHVPVGQSQGYRVAKEVNKLIASISKVEGDPLEPASSPCASRDPLCVAVPFLVQL